MRCGPDAETALGPLAESFLAQLRYLGVALLGGAHSSFDQPLAAVMERLEGRGRAMMLFFGVLENLCDPRCDGEAVLFNPLHWPAGATPDGCLDGQVAVRPSHLAVSYLTAWGMCAEMPGNFAAHVLRAALFECQERGLGSAIRYVLNLEESGYIIRPNVTATVLHALLAARARGKEETVVRRVSGHYALPESVVELDRVELRVRMGDTVSMRNVHRELALILDHADRACETARNADGYAAWWRAQYHLVGHLGWLLDLFAIVRGGKSIALTARLRHLEEIYCDAFSLAVNPQALYADYSLARAVWLTYQANGIPNAAARAVEERACIPRALLPFVETSGLVPEQWEHMSPTFAPIVSDVISGRSCQAMPRTEGDTSTEGERHDEIDRWACDTMVACGGVLRPDQVTPLLERYPWNSFLWTEAAIAADRQRNTPDALHCVSNAILLDPESAPAWQTLAAILDHAGEPRAGSIARLISTLVGSPDSSPIDDTGSPNGVGGPASAESTG